MKKISSILCQSCGMPMEEVSQFGTNSDGGQNGDYCVYCYKDGAFTSDLTMDGMIEQCAQFVDEFNKDSEFKVTREQAIANMQEYFPKLKRWK